MNKEHPPKNLLFIELIVVIAFFSLAAAICATLFVQAKVDAAHSRELTNAVIMAQNTAEIFKAYDGRSLPMFNEDGLISTIAVIETYEEALVATIVVYRESDGAAIYSLKVAVREGEEAYRNDE